MPVAKVDTESRIPIKMWLDDLEEAALVQARNVANLPFAYKWLCLMPDAHVGYGTPIGTVLAVRDVVIPNCVGVDIGCGMAFLETNIPVEVLKKDTGTVGRIVDGIVGNIKRNVPVGFSKHQKKQACASVDRLRQNVEDSTLRFAAIGEDILENAYYQVGTLGGGNHFIELQADENENLCLMIHSGSRNMGKRVCDYYNRVALELNSRWFAAVEPEWQLSFLPLSSVEGHEYMHWMDLSLEFAQENRDHMMQAVMSVVLNMVKKYDGFAGVELKDPVNIHHNYAAMENHHGWNLMVHRKGATRAREGQIGIIPGSMGSYSHIVEGLGNPESFQSCSHGAGRRMGRKEAVRSLDLTAERSRMEGIVHGMKTKEDLEEAPGAYKDLARVMSNQSDLVKVVKTMRPVAVVKG
jgi:tRNA-splicing ligase RtcB (3'-phosphate/5'-hydroxy nucleic acid ligase)